MKVEVLEQRQLLAADVFLNHGVLNIAVDDGRPAVVRTMVATEGVDIVRSFVEVTIGESAKERKQFRFGVRDVQQIDFSGSNLNDRFENLTGVESIARGYGGHDVLVGGWRSDQLYGGIGNDTVRGGAGEDTLSGGAGNDYLFGEGGDDRINGGIDNDWLYGGADRDILVGEDGANYLYGEDGNDDLWGKGGADTLIGGRGDDRLWGGDGDDKLYGDGQPDVVIMLSNDCGNDVLWGGLGDDLLDGGNGYNWLYGEEDNDTFHGGYDRDILSGGNGNDLLLGRGGNDDLSGDEGNDHLNGGAGDDRLNGGGEDDVLIAIDAAFDSYVAGGGGNDVFWIDPKDAIGSTNALDTVHRVSKFTNKADRTLDHDFIADPTLGKEFRYQSFGSKPLFSEAGPQLGDVRQGNLGDCYLLAGLGAIAQDSPHVLQQNLVDFDDGTYGVCFGKDFFRVDNELPAPVPSPDNVAYAALGHHKSMWVAIVEKAFTYYHAAKQTRDLAAVGQYSIASLISPSYSSIVGGWGVEIFRAFGAIATGQSWFSKHASAAALGDEIAKRLLDGTVTLGIIESQPKGLVEQTHEYTVVSVQRDSLGQIGSVTVRNPHGHDGSSIVDLNKNDGLITLTLDQLVACNGQISWARWAPQFGLTIMA